MNVVRYNYRIHKALWSDFTQVCRETYLNDHPLMQLLKFVADHGDNPLDSFKQVSETVNSFDSIHVSSDIQVFDEGDTYIIRPLELGYFFINNAREWGEFLNEITYGKGTDVQPEEEKNKVVSQWCDEKISRGDYFIFNVLSRDDFTDFAARTLSLFR